MPRPKPAVEPVQIALRLSPSQLARIDAEAADSKRSRNGVIGDAISFHLADREGRRNRAAVAAEDQALQADDEAREAFFAGKPVVASVPYVGDLVRKPYQKGQKR